MSYDISRKLRSVSRQLGEIADEYQDIKTTPSEEAMVWPLSIIKDEYGDVSVWCNKTDCVLDGHNSEINTEISDFTLAQLLVDVAVHIEHYKERLNDMRELQEG